tara:strand:+ start:812 stop:1165 length:354 start_codon:yes stop_codon:yes gene_type:complete
MDTKIDLSYLKEVTGGSTEIIQEMLELFLSETQGQIEQLKEKCTASEWEDVKAEAHKLKPTFLYVGLKDIHAKLEAIESNARNKENLKDLSILINSVEKEFNSVKGEVKDLIQQFNA